LRQSIFSSSLYNHQFYRKGSGVSQSQHGHSVKPCPRQESHPVCEIIMIRTHPCYTGLNIDRKWAFKGMITKLYAQFLGYWN
jgi:hypothetical protein